MMSNEKYMRGFLKPQNIPVGRKKRNPDFCICISTTSDDIPLLPIF